MRYPRFPRTRSWKLDLLFLYSLFIYSTEIYIGYKYLKDKIQLKDINTSTVLLNRLSKFQYTKTTTSQRQCISPDKSDWVFGGCPNENDIGITNIYSKTTSYRSCDICRSKTDPFSKFLTNVSDKLEAMKREECSRLVVYTIAFGDKYSKAFRKLPKAIVDQSHKFHNQCFFTFILADNEISNGESVDTVEFLESEDSLDLLIPVPNEILPYNNNRRNTKIFKMIGHELFRWTEILVWQDAKFRMDVKYPFYWPVNYFNYISTTLKKANVCAVYLGIPRSVYSLGTSSQNVSVREEGFQRHCDILSSSDRKGVSDTQDKIKEQCAYYEKYVNKTYSSSANLLSSNMVDSGLIVRDMYNDRCRKFNAELSCTWLDEIHCFSDRDQISFPIALASMGVHEFDTTLDPVTDHRIFVDKDNHPYLLILKSNCHYYFEKYLRKCFTNENRLKVPSGINTKVNMKLYSIVKARKRVTNARVAILVSGALRRYFLNSSLKHLVKPLSNQNHTIDYYLALSTDDVPTYNKNKDVYMNHLELDPIFNDIFIADTFEVKKIITSSIQEAGGDIRKIVMQNSIDIEDNELIKTRRRQAMQKFPKEDPYLRFPVKDLRSQEKKEKTANENKNILRMHLGTQILWNELVQFENHNNISYDYVLFLRDDVHWLEDFDLDSLISLNKADIYILSCDAREPPLTIDEVNDFAFVVSRKAAPLFGNYFTKLFEYDLDECTKSLRTPKLGNRLRGCNSEMILKWIIEKEKYISMFKVGQSFIPFQRSAFVRLDGDVTVCFHKYCQSQDDKLDDKGIKKCQQLRDFT